MPANRIGSIALVENTLKDVRASQLNLGNLQTQISSGFKSKTFEGINGSVEQFSLITLQLDRAKQFNTGNAVAISKMRTADAAMANITDIADEMKRIIVSANGATIKTSNIPQTMQDLVISMVNSLNTTFNGSYMFGGINSTLPPVPDPTIMPSVSGTPDANYYAGSIEDSSMRVDEVTTYDFPIRADDIAFQKIYAAAKQAMEAAREGDTTMMSRAQTLIQEGQSDLVAARSRLASTTQSVERIDDRFKALKIYWTELSDSMNKTDIVEASAQVSNYQAVLQATYQVYARLSQLRLVDYLR